jgi:heat-inducible transcriptional repressor
MRRLLHARIRELDKMVSEAGRMLSQMTRFPVYAMSPASRTLPTVRRFEIVPFDSRSFIVMVVTSTDEVYNKLIKLPFEHRPEDLRRLAGLLNSYFTDRSVRDISEEMILECASLAGSEGALVSLILDFTVNTIEAHADRDVFLTGTSNILNYPEYQNVEKARELMDFLTEENSEKLPEPDEDEDMKILIGPENVEKELRAASVVVVSYNMGGGQRGILGVVGPTRMNYAKVAANLATIAEGLKRFFSGGLLPPFDG